MSFTIQIKKFFKSCFLLICFSITGINLIGQAHLRDRPNIILMLIDDLGYDTAMLGDSLTGIGGGSQALELPTLRETLPNKGLTFTNAYASPVCTPSRVQLMTGKYLYKTYQQFGQINWNSRTMAQNLLWNGYNTAAAGKWQLQGNMAFKSPSAFEEDYQVGNLENPRRLGYNEYLLTAVLENGNIYSDAVAFITMTVHLLAKSTITVRIWY